MKRIRIITSFDTYLNQGIGEYGFVLLPIIAFAYFRAKNLKFLGNRTIFRLLFAWMFFSFEIILKRK